MTQEEGELTAHEWRAIARLWASLANVPVSDPDAAIAHLWGELPKIVPCEAAYVVLAHKADIDRRARRNGYFAPWVIAHAFLGMDCFRDYEKPVHEEYMRERVANDRWIRHFVETSGEHRTFIREDVLGDQPWAACETGWLLERTDVTDRMHSAYALDESVEAFLCMDRRGDAHFDRHDRELVHQINLGLGPFWARMTMSFGLYEHQEVLTKRERETLLHLLDGYSESAVADLMGLTKGTTHQYVVRVFRALNVNSRAELMAKWMGDLSVDTPV